MQKYTSDQGGLTNSVSLGSQNRAAYWFEQDVQCQVMYWVNLTIPRKSASCDNPCWGAGSRAVSSDQANIHLLRRLISLRSSDLGTA